MAVIWVIGIKLAHVALKTLDVVSFQASLQPTLTYSLYEVATYIAALLFTFLKSWSNPPIFDLPVNEYAGSDFLPTVPEPTREGSE